MKTKILLISLCSLMVAAAGCTSQNPEWQINGSAPSLENNSSYEASGLCYHVVDGDTIDVEGVGRIRLVGINTPEINQPGYQESKEFVSSMCLGKNVGLDIDNEKHYDKYGRVLAVVYVGKVNLNQDLLKKGYAEIMYLPPSEFNPYLWI